MNFKRLAFGALLAGLVAPATLSAQESKFEEVLGRGTLSGNIQIDAQMYFKDSLIGVPEVPEKLPGESHFSNKFLQLHHRIYPLLPQ